MNIINTWCPCLYGDDGEHSVCFVLTKDKAGKHAVYWGMASSSINANMIAHGGNKLSYEKALFAFPTLKEQEYRA